MPKTKTITTATAEPGSNSAPRALTEWLTLLALAVVLFRTFAIEGYMITTGSMAPSLLGHHQHIICSDCGFTFARGLGEDDQAGDATRAVLAENVAMAGGEVDSIWCPNCGRRLGSTQDIPRSEGDQILVHKHAFFWQDLLGGPSIRRWEVAVFHNPGDATMAYVKRIVGLPGEHIELVGGDVYIDGRLQAKPYDAQLGTRIVVHDNDFPPSGDDTDLRPRWTADSVHWDIHGGRFAMNDAGNRSRDSADLAWVTYQHWLRSGGTHTSAVRVPHWPAGVEPPDRLLTPLEYIPEDQELHCWGALQTDVLNQWLARSPDVDFQAALRQLYVDSHVAPITDECPYNRGPDRAPGHPMRDLMLELQLTCSRGSGEFCVRFEDGEHDRDIVLDAGARTLAVREPGRTETLITKALNAEVLDAPMLLQVSTFDGQLTVALNGEPVIPGLPLWNAPSDATELRSPFRFGGHGLDVTVEHVVLYRDVYYTTDPMLESAQFQLADDELFALGDNSPVSVDSRSWSPGALKSEMMIGKPLVVHLPSRPGTLEWRGRRHQIRVPDVSRMRYIR